MKKIVSTITIISVILLSILLLASLFEVIKLSGIYLKILLTIATIFIASFVSLNSITLVEKKNKFAIISLGLISLSVVLILLMIWIKGVNSSIYNKVTWSFATISIFFNFVVNFRLKLENHNLVLQGLTYTFYALTSIFILLMINVKTISNWDKIWYVLVPLILVNLVLTSILLIQGKKEDNSVMISKKEYQELLKIKEEYYELTKNNSLVDKVSYAK